MFPSDEFIQKIESEFEFIIPDVNLTVQEPHDLFTIWFISKYLDCPVPEADDAFVGGTNDFGIDAIYIPGEENQHNVAAYVIQTKFTSNPIDADVIHSLRAKQDWICKPLPENMNPRVRMKWAEMNQVLIGDAKVRFVVVTTSTFTEAAKAALDEGFSSPYVDTIDSYDRNMLKDLYYPGFETSVDGDLGLIQKPHELQAKTLIEVKGEAVPSWIAVVPLKSIATLPEINTKKLFAANVRYEISRATVKAEIKKTLSNPQARKRFFLLHNGITIVSSKVKDKGRNRLELQGFSVVNGCQSVVAVFQNAKMLDDDATVLVRIYETKDTELMRDISQYTNTQTAVQQRDLRSNTPIQKTLGENFRKAAVHYVVKRGEAGLSHQESYRGVIPNELAAQILYSFEQQLPHRAHRKDMLFKMTLHQSIFQNTTAEQIYVLWKLYEYVDYAKQDISLKIPDVLAKPALSTFTALASIRGLERWPKIIKDWPSIEYVYESQEWEEWFKLISRQAVSTMKQVWEEASEKQPSGEFDTIMWLKDSETINTLKKEIRRDEARMVANLPEFDAKFTPPFTSVAPRLI